MASSVVLGATGCGESFSVTGGTGASGGTGGTGLTTAASGGGGTLTTGSGGSTTTGPGECSEGEMKNCYTGPDGTVAMGICKPGTSTCTDGMWGACEGEVTPLSQEICDGTKDDNCNGQLDDDCDCSAGQSVTCYEGTEATKGVGECKNGMQSCLPSGMFGPCDGQVLPASEVCDGLDNNCSGEADSDVPGFGAGCDSGDPGVCGAGTKHCSRRNGLVCVGSPPTMELCDNLDNNCDGVVDNGIPQMSCMAMGANVNCPGKTSCKAGGITLCNPNAIFVDTFSGEESKDGWQLEDEWAIGPTAAGGANPGVGNKDPANDHTVTNDNGVAGVVLKGNASNNMHEAKYMTLSKPFDTTIVAGPLFLSFWRWLNTEVAPSDVDTVEVWNGVGWVVLWTNPLGVTQDAEWTFQKFDVSSYKNPGFKFRFGHAVGAAGPVVSSWNIDDIVLGGCSPN